MNITGNKRIIYADCAAQSRPLPCATEAAAEAMNLFGNPSGVHRCAKAAARMLFDARRKVAAAIGAQAAEIVFVSSATEAANTAVLSAAREGRKRGRTRLLIFACEHHSVLNAAHNTADLLGAAVELIPCRSDGTVDLAAFEKMCGDDVCLCALMSVNNETGVIQPVKEFARIAHSRGALVLCDAAQSVGHLPVDVGDMGCDMLSLSAHKFGGIPGAGALFCRNGLTVAPLIAGGGQESRRRSGTEALPAICAMGAAIEASVASMADEGRRVAELRDRLEAKLSAHQSISVIGNQADRAPSILCVCARNTDGEALALYLDREGICVSSGAACTTGSDSASHVLLAMGIDKTLARGSIRFSLDTAVTEEDVDAVAEAVVRIVDSGAVRI
ncbi:MAG: cysteine desulfurase [Ruminococcaceae bacterium]|nr:cysteine desulfurase [Oscillospiraceae bacterium]